ncbi:2Fe-2S iron-sulfur cluster-binding protein [Egbenema bharatensis]|uniref:2Fe-2S iron-sulfur cluster-binding protein n=1 Tax=Egbenema bharatensis TaxID=3463334 RepID=UPI003A84529D
MLKLKSVNFEQQQFQIHQLSQSRSGQMEWMIGRNSTCDLILTNPEVSRVHGQIIYSDETYHFIDVGSTAGSLLNGEVVPANQKQALHAGDLLQLGETFLYVEELSPPEPISLISQSDSIAETPLPVNQWTAGDLTVRCCRIIEETPDVKTFCFAAEPAILFNYKPGQFVNLEVEIDGKPVIRSYSISSSPSRPWHIRLTVKRVYSPADDPDAPPGLVSNWLHDHLKVGDRIKLIGGVCGHFTCLPDLPAKLLLISAGSGITPMMSMSRWVQDTLAKSDIVFLHSARTPEDIIFRRELETMATQMSNFHLAVTLTQPANHPWMGLTGRISKSMLNLVVPDLHDRAVFVCGQAGFMHNIKATLETMNFPMQNYQEESFGGRKKSIVSAQPTVSANVEPPTTLLWEPSPSLIQGSHAHNHANHNHASHNGNGQHASHKPHLEATSAGIATADPAVCFAKSGQEVAADGTTSILELAEQEGIEIRNACRVGACGACKVHAREGKVHYDSQPAALTEKDREAGYVLACVAYPVDRLVVDA